MPDLYTVDAQGGIVEIVRDRSGVFERIFGIGNFSSAVVYRGDPHDVQAPERINPVARAARLRRRAWFDSFELCVNCQVDEDGHRVYEDFNGQFEKADEDACDDYTRPAPLCRIKVSKGEE